jgi:diguanylate cyclase (GGDEF)-like protein/PAS domain S-box-containing protein
MASSEDASQAFVSAPDKGDRGHGECAHAGLAAAKALLNIERAEDFDSEAFKALRRAFAFDQALVLEDRDGEMHCVAAWPDEPIGRRWPADPFLRGIIDGAVVVTGDAHPAVDGQRPSPDLIAPGAAALCLPVAIGDRRAALILLREEESEGFGEDQVALARQCAVVALAALAARTSNKREAQIQRLTRLAEQLQQSEQSAQKDGELLKQIIDALPISLTVQGDDGRFILVNAIAAANLATPADVLIGASPGDFLPDEDAANRREWEMGLLQSGETHSAEENVVEADGQHVWLTTHKPVRIFEQSLLLTSSVEITRHKQVESQLAQRAHFDELTGLPNRILMQARFAQALHRRDQNARFALAFIDLDNFKHINDYYSHPIGDEMLVKIAQRITGRIRPTDTLARISGDEFLLLIDPLESEDQIRAMINAILEDLKKPFHIEAFEVFTSASIGVSIYPDHGTTYEELRRNADSAMYQAKSDAKGSAIYFDVKMGQSLAARMRLEQRLRLAIRDRKFCCAFQPKVDIRTEEVVGFETLVRWRDENGDIQAPGTFIGLAIELGLIDPITHFVLTETLESMARLDDAFGSDTTMSINIAAKQASDLEFMKSITADLRESRYAERMMLEVTEDAFFAKSRFQTDVLPMLREIGVRVSIDDFGTGYSSLSALADITADEIKVDRSFITRIHERPRSQSVLRAIESLGRALGMTIIAEGIETFEELAYLQAATRIHYAQGFYFSKPFFLEDIDDAREVNLDTRTPEPTRPRLEQREYSAQRVAAGRQTRFD